MHKSLYEDLLTKQYREVLDALNMAYKAMNYMGDILNDHDMVLPEDNEKTDPAFETVREVLDKHNKLKEVNNLVMNENEEMDMDTWFSLSRASWLTVPRIVLQSMPVEWQHNFTKLLNEMNATFDWVPDGLSLYVTGKKGNRFVRLPYCLNDYRRGKIEHLRKNQDREET